MNSTLPFGKASQTGELRGLRILVVDDSSDFRELLRLWVEQVGATAVSVPDGEAAIRAASESTFDVALVDVTMPGMDGFECVRRLRKNGHTFTIVFVTATKSFLQVPSDIQSFVGAHLGKPIDKSKLVETVRGLVAIREI